MTDGFVIQVGRDALWTALLLAAPVLGLSLAVGLIVSVFQATTQINEQTLAFIPKIVVVLLAVVLFGPWMLSTMLDFTRHLYGQLPGLVR